MSTQTQAQTSKPRIWKSRSIRGMWFCHGHDERGMGASPALAYSAWIDAMLIAVAKLHAKAGGARD